MNIIPERKPKSVTINYEKERLKKKLRAIEPESDELDYDIGKPNLRWLRWGVIVFLLLVDIVINLGQNTLIVRLIK